MMGLGSLIRPAVPASPECARCGWAVSELPASVAAHFVPYHVACMPSPPAPVRVRRP